MSAATTGSIPRATGPDATPTVLRRTIAAEWSRLRTLRSTWLAVSVGAGLMLFVATVAALDHAPGDPAPIHRAAEFGIVPGQFAFLAVVVLLVAGEYATGAIASTLQWTPRRGVVLAARALVPVTFAAGGAVVVAAAADLVAWVLLGPEGLVVAADVATSLARVAGVVAAGAALAVGLALLLRSTAGTLVALFLLMLVLPAVLPQFGVALLATIGEHLPGHAVLALLQPEEFDVSTSRAVIVLVVWATASLAAGGWSLLARDAT